MSPLDRASTTVFTEPCSVSLHKSLKSFSSVELGKAQGARHAPDSVITLSQGPVRPERPAPHASRLSRSLA